MKRIYLAKTKDTIDPALLKEVFKEGDSYFVEDTEENRIKYESILPLGFASGKIHLQIDLIPKTSWGASLAGSLTPESWASIRKPFIAHYGNRCQICGRRGENLNKTIRDVDTHELWEYFPSPTAPIQKLVGFVSVCSACHLMFHLGFAESISKKEITIKRLQKIEKLTDKEMDKRVSDIFKLWNQRSDYDWIIDISILKEYGFDNIKFIDKVNPKDFIL